MPQQNSQPSMLPSRGRTSKLESLIRDRPSDYAMMIEYNRAGAFAKTAAAAVGVSPETFSRWFAKGETATSGPYRQFYQDLVQAVGLASVLAEADVHRADAKHWLKCGPRRMLGEERERQRGERDHDSERAALDSLTSIAGIDKFRGFELRGITPHGYHGNC